MYDWQFLEDFFTWPILVEYWTALRRESEGKRKKKGYMAVEGGIENTRGCW